MILVLSETIGIYRYYHDMVIFDRKASACYSLIDTLRHAFQTADIYPLPIDVFLPKTHCRLGKYALLEKETR